MIKSILMSLSIEILKIRRSMIFWISIGVGIFLSLMIGLMMFLALHPDSLPQGILKTKIELADFKADWPSYLDVLELASGAIGIIIFGFIVSWIFGREYTDKTVKDLLSLPSSRSAIVVSKLLAVVLWCMLISFVIFVCSLGLGLMLELPLWSPALLPNSAKIFFTTTLLSLLLCPPAAYVASAGKSFLPAIGFVILCMGLANFFANIGLGAYFPWAIPMIYTGTVGEVNNQLQPVSFVIIFLTGFVGTVSCILQWKYADQSR